MAPLCHWFASRKRFSMYDFSSDLRRLFVCLGPRGKRGSDNSPRGSDNSPRVSDNSPRGSDRDPGASPRGSPTASPAPVDVGLSRAAYSKASRAALVMQCATCAAKSMAIITCFMFATWWSLPWYADSQLNYACIVCFAFLFCGHLACP